MKPMERIENRWGVMAGECRGTGRVRTALQKFRQVVLWLLTPEDSRNGFAAPPEVGPFRGRAKAVFWFFAAVLISLGISRLR
ncbi:hypothetical protein [Desulfonema ishimotonii]|uniref:hypothetical protein n=1 Tax=Desulfonema ishimotonii TaxID=45657 RepID=UPI000F55E09C|nr:hypothetical protein [Desulfonema ishimotonii]